MGRQIALVLAVCVGLAAPSARAARAAQADAKLSSSTPAARTAKSKKQKRVRARKRAQKKRRRQRANAKRANRPDGWQWPPSDEMRAAGKVCKEELSALGVQLENAPFTRGVASPIYVPDMIFDEVALLPTFRKPPFVIDCHLALALRQVAPALTQAGVRSLRFSSIYNYRRAIVGGKQKASLSRHSYGLAIDVFQVERADGEILKVADAYHEGEFLKGVEEAVNQSGKFRLVLSPDNDPRSHSDHLHFEADVNYPKLRGDAAKSKAKSKGKSKAKSKAKSKSKARSTSKGKARGKSKSDAG